jgi:hypothetical protein
MEVNPLRRVLTAKATTFVGLAMLVAVVMLVIASIDSVGQAGAQPKPKPKPPGQFGAEAVINATGGQGFPINGTYTSKGGTLILYASGSGYSNAGDEKIGMTVNVEGAKKGTAWTYTNEKLSHKAFVPAALVVKNQPAGQLQIELDSTGYTNTKIDGNDNFRVTVLEIPK